MSRPNRLSDDARYQELLATWSPWGARRFEAPEPWEGFREEFVHPWDGESERDFGARRARRRHFDMERGLPGGWEADRCQWTMGNPGNWASPNAYAGPGSYANPGFRGGFGRHLGRPGEPVVQEYASREWAQELAPVHRGRFSGVGPKNYRRRDERIRDEVCEVLTEDGVVDASDIDVAVAGGEVTLTGTVYDRKQKRRAEDLTERCAGVAEVHNKLRVDKDTATAASMRETRKLLRT
jgi:hypothetical protein